MPTALAQESAMNQTERKFVPGYLRKYRRKRAAKLWAAIAAATLVTGSAADPALAPSAETTQVEKNGKAHIMDVELEDLMKMQVHSVSRKTERLSDAAAAIFVI